MKYRSIVFGLVALAFSACARFAPPEPPVPLFKPQIVQHQVAVPAVIDSIGGFYVPWNPVFAEHRRDVLLCVGLTDTTAAPTVWIASRELFSPTGPLMAYYDWRA